jgi:GrpB-like predicted nucleotidyltransferase (UPF0157 family)
VSNDPIEERLREVIIGEIEPQSIVVVDYDPAWPEHFRREEARIRSSLGEAALSVEHIGSTSVPGLAAKPIVDVLLVVEDSGDEPSYLPALEAAGYVLRVHEPESSTSTGCLGPRKRMCIFTSSRRARRRSNATCCYVTTCVKTKRIGSSTPGRNVSSRAGTGRACSTTLSPRPGLSKASSLERLPDDLLHKKRSA